MTRNGKAGRVYELRCGSGWPVGPPDLRPEPVMTVARTVADVLAEHVTFEVECIDRMFLNVYVPQWTVSGLVDRQLNLPGSADRRNGYGIDTSSVHR